jgi:hypothetical protein
MKKPKGSASSPGQHDHHPAIIDPPNHVAIPPPEVHHPHLQRHAALKANALMANVMAQARGARGDIGPYLVLQPTVNNSVLIGPTDEEGIGIDVVAAGVSVQIEPWTPMAVGDQLDLFWGTYPGTPTVGKKLTTTDELSKPVVLPVPDSVIADGWVNVVAQVTRNGSGFQDLSPARPLWVKLDPPGDLSPPPAENANLAAPILPPNIIANGVDAIASANGVPVTISPYPNMAEGDRIRLNWGGVYIERTVVKASVGQPVTLTADDATIRNAGDSDALIVRYQVFDVVNNRSGWSPSTTVAVNVVGGNLYPPEIPKADANDVVDLDLLDGDALRVLVTAIPPDFALGDVVTLNWTGHTAGGTTVPYSDTQTVTRNPPQTLEFLVPNATVAALAQGDAVVTYSLPGGRTSQQTTITIIGTGVSLLPMPSMVEAPDGYLDASLSSATVIVPANPVIQPGGVVTLIWSGVRADGQSYLYQSPKPVTGSMVGKDVPFSVPSSEITPLDGGTLQVSYTVMTIDGTLLPASEILNLWVGDAAGALLPNPTVTEAPDNATLDPDDVTLQAEVVVPAYTGMATGDRIDIYWVGSKTSDTYSDWTLVGVTMVGRQVPFSVDKDPYVTANDGGTVTVSYTVTKTGSLQSSTPLTLQVGEDVGEDPYPVIRTDIVVTEADPYTNTLSTLKIYGASAHVVINYDNMKAGDKVTMTWQGTPGSGTNSQATTVTKVGPVTIEVDNTVIAPNYNRSVTISYIVRRVGETDDESPSLPLILKIENIPSLGVCTFQSGTSNTWFKLPCQSSITIPSDLEVGKVILTTGVAGPVNVVDKTAMSTYSCSTTHSSLMRNINASQPAAASTLFATPIEGVGFRLVYNDNYVAAGPVELEPGTYSNANAIAKAEFVKTGPMAKTGTLRSGDGLAFEYKGSSLAYMTWLLANNLTINVVSRRSIEGKRITSTRARKS